MRKQTKISKKVTASEDLVCSSLILSWVPVIPQRGFISMSSNFFVWSSRNTQNVMSNYYSTHDISGAMSSQFDSSEILFYLVFHRKI